MEKKTLVVCYSHSGVTKKAAVLLQDITGCDLYEVKSMRVYAPDMWTADAESKADRKAGKLPELAGELPDLSGYDAVLIGGPVWGGTLANPLAAYLDKTDFGGKTVAGFWTFMDYEGNYGDDFKEQCKNAVVQQGLSLTGNVLRGADLNKKMDAWLKSAGIR